MTVYESTQQAYNQLSSEYFTLVKSEPFPEEIDFYKNVLDTLTGLSLYAMCGAGRLLIPLLSSGYNIDGMDYSTYMLENCRENANNKGLQVNLFQQSMQEMSLDKRYECIFIIGGSFQLIYPREAAIKSLHNAKDHLIEGGRLYIDTFIPWELLYENTQEEIFTNEVQHYDGSSIKLETHTITNRLEQYFLSHNNYTKLRDARVLGREEEFMPVSWYYHYETILLLESVGFKNIKRYDTKLGLHPELTVYEATY